MVVTVEGSITFFRAIHLLKRFGAITLLLKSHQQVPHNIQTNLKQVYQYHNLPE